MIVAPDAVVVAELSLDVDHVSGCHPRAVRLLEGDKWRIHAEPLSWFLIWGDTLACDRQCALVILIVGDVDFVLTAVVLLPNPEEAIYVGVMEEKHRIEAGSFVLAHVTV